MMKAIDVDSNEQAFVERALAAADRAQRRDQIRAAVATAAAFSAAIWFAFRPSSPQLGVEATICVVLGSMLAAATAKLRSLIQQNTRLILQALAAARPQSDGVSARPSDR